MGLKEYYLLLVYNNMGLKQYYLLLVYNNSV